MHRSASLPFLIACAALGLVPGAQSFAADANTEEGPALEEITVTATRREESINRVPISMSAFNQEMIDQRGIKDIQDIVRFTPGVSIDTSGTNAISIRGISSSAGAGTTGIYIDDTPIQMRALGFNPDDTLPKTFDLDRVEILRGPQGTLFGSGSEGGTVRYIMNQPSVTKESTYSRAEVSYTKSGQPSGEVGIAHGGPIIDDVLGFRASVWYRYDGGWIDRVDPTTDAVTEKNANHANTIAARLAFLVQPIEALKVTPSFTYQNSRKHDTSTFWPAYGTEGHYNNATPERIPDPDAYWLAAVKIEANLGFATMIADTSYYHRNEFTGYQGTVFDLAYLQAQPASNGFPCAGGEAPPCSWYPLIDGAGIHTNVLGTVTPNTMTNQQRNWTQELRLQSNDEPGSRFKWTVGGFWSLATEISIENIQDQYWNNMFSTFFGDTANDIYGPYYNCPATDPANSTPQTPSLPDCSVYYNYNKTHDRQLAGFGEATYKITDQFSITGGLRYASLTGDRVNYANGYENYGPLGNAGTYTEHALTPKASASYQLTEQNLFYVTYAKGFRPGGFNAILPPYCSDGLMAEGYESGQSPLTYKPDDTQSFEIGAKNGTSAFHVSTSLYYIRWNNIQQNVYIGGSCALQFTDNLGTAVSKGFDVQAELALGYGVSLEFSLGYTNSRFTETLSKEPGAPALAAKGDGVPGEAGINYAPGLTPPWTIALGPQYDFNVAGYKSFVRADWEYTSRNPYLSPDQDPNAAAQYNSGYSYTLPYTSFVSLRSGITIKDFQISAFCDNLFDSRTIINYSLGQLDPNNLATTPQENRYMFRPRTVGLTFTYHH